MKKTEVDVENSKFVERGNYSDTLQRIIDEGHCPFCEEHLLKHHRKPILERSEHWLVTENNWPYAGTRFHFLLISKAHTEKIEDLSKEAWADFQRQYRALCKKNKITGATIIWRSGATALTGATVNHLHAHVVSGGERGKDTPQIKALVGFEISK